MARHAITRQKLRCRDGHWEFAEFIPTKLDGGGWGMVARCDLGDHWLVATATNAVAVAREPYAWPTANEAFEARDRWEQQEAVRHPEETTS
jgi:hypothetical protein